MIGTAMMAMALGRAVADECAGMPRSEALAVVCAQPPLHALQRRIDGLGAGLRRHYRGEQARVFAEGVRYFRIERQMCARPDPGDTVSACLRQTLGRRLRTLQRLDRHPQALAGTVAGYRYVYPDYLQRFASAYQGRTVRVFGVVRPEHCSRDGRLASARAALVFHGTSAPLRLPTVSAAQGRALCSRAPAHWWRVRVQVRDRRLQLTWTPPAATH